MIRLIEVNGEKHIQTGNSAVPISNVLDACTQGAFDDCHDFYKVVRLYLDNGNPENDATLMPLFRQMVATEAVAWIAEKNGEAAWRHNYIHMPIDIAVMRVALIAQIEGALATVKEGPPLHDKASTFYQGMLSFEANGGGMLTQMGKETIQEMFDGLIDDLVEGNLDFSATKH